MKILLAEDDLELLELMKYILQREGYIVVTALKGMAALEKFRSEQPDLVCLDIMMPKLSGIEVLRAIREQSRVPILMLTAIRDKEAPVRALDLGADDYLTKPMDLKELRARIRALLRRTQNQKDATDKPK